MTDTGPPTDDSPLIPNGSPKRDGAVRALIAIEDSEASWDAVVFAARLLDENDETMVVNVASSRMPLFIAAGGLMTYPTMYPGYTYANPAPEGAVAAGPTSASASGEPLMTDAEAGGRRAVEEAGELLHTEATGVVHGDPVDRITRLAEENDVDLIVVGTGDPGFFSRMFGGPSVSRGIVDKAPCSVLVVR